MKTSVHNVYGFMVGIIVRHPVSVILVAALGVGLSLLVAATQLELHTSRLDLISAGEHYKHLDQVYQREFGNLPELIIAVIRAADAETAKAFATVLGQRWEGDPTFETVLYRIDVEALQHKALLYLSPEELTALRQKLQEHHDLLQELTTSPTLQNLFALINREITMTLVGHIFTGFLDDGGKEQESADLSLLLALLQEMNQWLAGKRTVRSPWERWLTRDDEAFSHDGFLWSEDKHLLFVLANPKEATGEFNHFKQAVQRIRADVRELQYTYPGVEVGITGRAVLDADEMGAVQRDTAIATVIAVVGVTLLYFGLFRGVIWPLLALAALGTALCWSLGFTTLTIGHLNILSIVFMPMLVGLGIDYGSYFIARYEEERSNGRGVQQALAETFITTGPGIITTALTTAVTFGSLLLTGFKGLAELGFIGGSGILLAAVGTLTVLPALLVLAERRRQVAPPQRRLHPGTRGGYLEPLYRHPRATLAASTLLVGMSLLTSRRVGGDFNLLHLKAEGTESVIWLQRVFESTKRSVLFGEIVAESMGEVKRKASALKALPSVATVDSIASVIPKAQELKLPLIRDLQPFLADISLQWDKTTSVDLDALRETLRRIEFKMVEDDEVVGDSEEARFGPEMHEVRHLIDQFMAMTEQMGSAAALQALSGFQEELFRDLEEKLAVLQANLRAEPVTSTDLPPALRTRYIGKTGKFRLLVFPAQDIWEFHPLSQFVADLRTVDPDALGTPVMNFEYLRGMKEAYEQAGLYAFLGIVLLAIVTFRAVQPTLLALIPLAVGSLWTLGFMGLLQIKFNVANLLVLPLVMAPAVESGIMIVYRSREESKRSLVPLPLPKSTGQAVVFSALSTIIGFGSLMISRHRGISSIGLLLTLGVGSVLLASLTVLPSLVALLAASRRTRGDV